MLFYAKREIAQWQKYKCFVRFNKQYKHVNVDLLLCGFAFELHLYFFHLLLLTCRLGITYDYHFETSLRNLVITGRITFLFLFRLERQCKSFFKHFVTNQKVTSATHSHFSRQSLKCLTPFSYWCFFVFNNFSC